MKNYRVVFYNGKKPICWKMMTAKDEDDAKLGAEFWLKFHYDEVEYDRLEAEEVQAEAGK